MSLALRGAAEVLPRVGSVRVLSIAFLAGLAAWTLNGFVVELGWGLHFLFGNIVVWVLLRPLGGPLTVLAISLASTRTILLWSHPWAWLVWTLGAVVVVATQRRITPIMAMTGFWLALGGPLILAAYAGVMGMDVPAAGLVALKQGVNAVANVVIAEVLYVVLATLARRWRGERALPAIPARAAMLAVLMAFVMVPALIVLSLRTAESVASVDELVRAKLALAVTGVATGLENRVAGRASELQVFRGLLGDDAIVERSGECLTPVFDDPRRGESAWLVRARPGRQNPFAQCDDVLSARTLEAVRAAWARGRPDVGDVYPQPDKDFVHFELTAPFLTEAFSGVLLRIIASRDVDEALADQDELADVGILVLDRDRRVLAGNLAGPPPDSVRDWMAGLGAQPPGTARVLHTGSFGTSFMTTLKDAIYVRAENLTGALDGGMVVAFFRPADLVAAQREGEAVTFAAVVLFMLLALALAFRITVSAQTAIRSLGEAFGRAAARKGENGLRRGLAIVELDQLHDSYERVARILDDDRARISAYDRLLRLVAEHAPIIVYVRAVEETPGAGSGSPSSGPTLENFTSGSIERLLGYRVGEVETREWWQSHVHPEDRPHVFAKMAHLRSGQPISCEYRLQTRSGDYIWVYDTAVASVSPETGAMNMLGIAFDVTARKEAELQLIQSAKLASVGEMATGMAHELKQPLSTIRIATANISRQMKKGELDPEAVAPRLDRIGEQTRRAADLIDRMRDFGRKPQEGAAPFAVEAAVDGAVALFRAQLEAETIDLSVGHHADGARILGHETLLQQVIVNLVLNAVDAICHQRKAGHQAGTIAIATGCRTGGVTISVADDGGGIDRSVRERIFEPFFTTKEIGEGTGLGLSISSKIVREMGGTINVDNVGAGAVFTLAFPLAD